MGEGDELPVDLQVLRGSAEPEMVGGQIPASSQ
jgi:hypothetical protein